MAYWGRILVVKSLPLVALLAIAGCSPALPTFHCTTNPQCTLGGKPGLCVDSDGVCAVADNSCPSGYRYDATAGGDRANHCVVFPAGTDLEMPTDMGTAPACMHDSDCTNGGMAPCGGTCTNSQCVYPAPTTDCGSTCTAGKEMHKSCDGRGSCALSMLDCGPYTCDSSALHCRTTCSGAGDCNGTVCTMNHCVACPTDQSYVPAGTFTMGWSSSPNDAVIAVTLTKGFCIDQSEVTVAQYRACVTAGVCTAPDAASCSGPSTSSYSAGNDNLPVNCVTWAQANTYCTWSGLMGGARRLPTEAEWERAARSTDGRTYPWGSAAPDCSYANYRGAAAGAQCVGGTTHLNAVGTDSPKGDPPSGIRDAAGNVQEWTIDCYVLNYTAGGVCTASCIDPVAPGNPTAANCGGTPPVHTYRGGSYDDDASFLPPAVRHGYAGSADWLGFRCAK